ncbi:YbgC/FadM family acyl-CoA thioesterase [soil metagenome]
MSHITEITVRGYHLDLYRHVNNARYLEFLEEARWQTYDKQFERAGLLQKGLAFVIVNINIDYKRPAGLGEVLNIVNTVERIGGKSVTIRQHMFLKDTDTTVVSAAVTVVLMDIKTGKAVPLEGDLAKLMYAEE